VLSEEVAFDCGVLQGSCLRSLLFTIFKADLADALLDGDMTMLMRMIRKSLWLATPGNRSSKKRNTLMNNGKNWLNGHKKLSSNLLKTV